MTISLTGGKHHGSFGTKEFQLSPAGSLVRTGTPPGLPRRPECPGGRRQARVIIHQAPMADQPTITEIIAYVGMSGMYKSSAQRPP
jgi:hypothetical protein